MGQKSMPRVLVCVLLGVLAGAVQAATPAEMLDEATGLYQQGEYARARDILMAIERDQLTPEQASRRDELMDEVVVAINQSTKAAQDLEDADKALAAGERARAARLYQAVIDNAYAGQQARDRARQGLATIDRQRELDTALADSSPATRPAEASAATAPAEEAATAERPGDELDNARRQRKRALAAAAIKAGDEALERGQFDLAESKFQEALKLVANHPAALNGLELVRQHRQVEGRGPLMDEARGRRDVRQQRTEVLLAEQEREIRRLIADRQFEPARQKLAVSRRTLEAARLDFEPAQRYEAMVRQLDAVERLIDREEREYNESRAAEQRREVRQRELERQLRDQKDRDERIGQLFDQVMQYQRDRRYDKAAEVLREILVIDPTYDRARFLLEVVEDTYLIQDEKHSHKRFVQRMEEALHQAELAKVPEVTGAKDKIMAYPTEDEWRIIAARDPVSIGLLEESNPEVQTEKKLATVIPPVELDENMTLRSVFERLEEVGGIRIYPAWKALGATAQVMPDDPLGTTMTLRNVTLERAIKQIIRQIGEEGAEIGYIIDGDGIIISTREDIEIIEQDKLDTQIFDVKEIINPLGEYSRRASSMSGYGGMMGMGMMGMGMMGMGMGGYGGMGMGGYGGMMGGYGGMMGGYGGMGMGGYGGYGGGYGGYGGGYGGYGGEGGEEDQDDERDELIDAIQETVAPESWDLEGRGITGWQEKIFVTNTPEILRKVARKLNDLRPTNIQVAIESRFIRLQSNFLEQIGVDLDIILNQGNAGLDNALVSGSTGGTGGGGGTGGVAYARDPVTGALLLQPRQFTQYGFYPGVPAGYGNAFPQTALNQPYSNVALVPQGHPSNWWSRHTTPLPIVNNTLALASPRETGVPGNLAGDVGSLPGFQLFGSFLDNIQVDFLIRATQMDTRSSVVDAPRIVTPDGEDGEVEVTTQFWYVAQPGLLPAGGSGVGGYAAQGRPPTIAPANRTRSLRVKSFVMPDRKYVRLELAPLIQDFRLRTFQDTTGPLQQPEYDFTRVRTTAFVPDRGWLLLGGLKQAGESEVEAGVPIISKIPVLKRAYTNRAKTKDEFVILVLVKPTIMFQDEVETAAYPELAAGRNGTK